MCPSNSYICQDPLNVLQQIFLYSNTPLISIHTLTPRSYLLLCEYWLLSFLKEITINLILYGDEY